MNNVLTKTIIFAAGAAIGSAVTWKLLKTKYEEIANEEIRSVKETFSRRLETLESESKKMAAIGEKLTEGFKDGLKEGSEPVKNSVNKVVNNYEQLISNLGYKGEEGEDEEMKIEKPYVIAPDEFGDMVEYDTVSLTYYEDGVLTDEMDEIIEDVDSIVGVESLTHFGEYEDDSVFVRNDRLKTDYEILLDLRKYSDVYRI